MTTNCISKDVSITEDLSLKGAPPNPTSLSVSVSMDVLNTSLVGVYNKRNENYPDKKELEEITEFLVTPTDSPKGGMTIKQLVQEVNKMIKDLSDSSEELKEEQVQEKLDLVSQGGILDKIKVELRQIFLYQQETITYSLDEAGKKIATPKSKQKSLEYAINFVILSEITTSTAFNIKSISLAVWNTKRPSVLKRMQIGDIQDLLKE